MARGGVRAGPWPQHSTAFCVGTVADTGAGVDGAGQGKQELFVIAHRLGYALVHGASALNAVPVIGHGCDNRWCAVRRLFDEWR